MGARLSDELSHFATSVAAYALALMVIFLICWVTEKLGWRRPIDPIEWFRQFLRKARRSSEPTVNVEFRDAEDTLLDLGPFVDGTLRNGRCGLFRLHEGVFADCDSQVIRLGKIVVVSLLDGLVKETLNVRLDSEKDTLFVQSSYTRIELLAIVNRGGDPKASPGGFDE